MKTVTKKELEEMVTTEEIKIKQLIAQGYRRISGKYGIVSRIDREDWKEYMAAKYAPLDIERGRKWVNCLAEWSAEDNYRRCNSKDVLELGMAGRKIPSSNGVETTGFIPKTY